LGRFYAALLAGGASGGHRILLPATGELLRTRHLTGLLDETFNIRLDRGLGVVVDSKRYGSGSAWFGSHCSEDTFGHGGFRCSVGFADPTHSLAVAIVFNGMPSDAAHEARMRETLATPISLAAPGPAPLLTRRWGTAEVSPNDSRHASCVLIPWGISPHRYVIAGCSAVRATTGEESC
jgi:CubicO group peptidase (beta-lactamase class C family)